MHVLLFLTDLIINIKYVFCEKTFYQYVRCLQVSPITVVHHVAPSICPSHSSFGNGPKVYIGTNLDVKRTFVRQENL